MGVTLAFVGFVLSRDYLIIVGALCITGGYSLYFRASEGIKCKIFDAFFKSWNDNSFLVENSGNVGKN
jgi:hypothetical protein